eukprot:6605059-Pyramimonas_sp.AAC.1
MGPDIPKQNLQTAGVFMRLDLMMATSLIEDAIVILRRSMRIAFPVTSQPHGAFVLNKFRDSKCSYSGMRFRQTLPEQECVPTSGPCGRLSYLRCGIVRHDQLQSTSRPSIPEVDRLASVAG